MGVCAQARRLCHAKMDAFFRRQLVLRIFTFSPKIIFLDI